MPTALDRNTCLCKICLGDMASGSKHVCRLSCSCNRCVWWGQQCVICRSHNRFDIFKIRIVVHHFCHLTSPNIYIFISQMSNCSLICAWLHCYNIQCDLINNHRYLYVKFGSDTFLYVCIDSETYIINVLKASKREVTLEYKCWEQFTIRFHHSYLH